MEKYSASCSVGKNPDRSRRQDESQASSANDSHVAAGSMVADARQVADASQVSTVDSYVEGRSQNCSQSIIPSSQPLITSTPVQLFKKPSTSWKRKIYCSNPSVVGKGVVLKKTNSIQSKSETEMLLSKTRSELETLQDELQNSVC